MSFCNTQNVKRSRKRHQCDLCFERIEIGHPYCRRSGMNQDNEFFTMKMHPECQEKEMSMPYHKRESWYEFPEEPLFERPKS